MSKEKITKEQYLRYIKLQSSKWRNFEGFSEEEDAELNKFFTSFPEVQDRDQPIVIDFVDDIDIAMAWTRLPRHDLMYSEFSENVQSNLEVIIGFLKAGYHKNDIQEKFKTIMIDFVDDIDVAIRIATIENGRYFPEFSKNVQSNPKVIIAYLKAGYDKNDIQEKFKTIMIDFVDDIDVAIRIATIENGRYFPEFSKNVQSNPEVIIAYLKAGYNGKIDLDETFTLKHKKNILNAMREIKDLPNSKYHNGKLYNYLSAELQKDLDIVKESFEAGNIALENYHERPEITATVVRYIESHHKVYKSAKKIDPDLSFVIRRDFICAPSFLVGEKEFIIGVYNIDSRFMNFDSCSFDDLPKTLQKDRDIIRASSFRNIYGKAIHLLNDDDQEFVLQTIAKGKGEYQYQMYWDNLPSTLKLTILKLPSNIQILKSADLDLTKLTNLKLPSNIQSLKSADLDLTPRNDEDSLFGDKKNGIAPPKQHSSIHDNLVKVLTKEQEQEKMRWMNFLNALNELSETTMSMDSLARHSRTEFLRWMLTGEYKNILLKILNVSSPFCNDTLFEKRDFLKFIYEKGEEQLKRDKDILRIAVEHHTEGADKMLTIEKDKAFIIEKLLENDEFAFYLFGARGTKNQNLLKDKEIMTTFVTKVKFSGRCLNCTGHEPRFLVKGANHQKYNALAKSIADQGKKESVPDGAGCNYCGCLTPLKNVKHMFSCSDCDLDVCINCSHKYRYDKITVKPGKDIQAYLDEARMKGSPTVSLVLGKGEHHLNGIYSSHPLIQYKNSLLFETSDYHSPQYLHSTSKENEYLPLLSVSLLGTGTKETTIYGNIFIIEHKRSTNEQLTVSINNVKITSPNGSGLYIKGNAGSCQNTKGKKHNLLSSHLSVKVKDATFENCLGAGIAVERGATVDISKCIFLKNKGCGVRVSGNGTQGAINECTFIENKGKASIWASNGARTTLTKTNCSILFASNEGSVITVRENEAERDKKHGDTTKGSNKPSCYHVNGGIVRTEIYTEPTKP
jgi:hypothetical protein